MTFKEIVNYRRSVRYFDETKNIDSETVKECLQLSTLAPNSSNMQSVSYGIWKTNRNLGRKNETSV